GRARVELVERLVETERLLAHGSEREEEPARDALQDPAVERRRVELAALHREHVRARALEHEAVPVDPDHLVDAERLDHEHGARAAPVLHAAGEPRRWLERAR